MAGFFISHIMYKYALFQCANSPVARNFTCDSIRTECPPGKEPQNRWIETAGYK